MYLRANSTGVIYVLEKKFQQKEGRVFNVYYRFKPLSDKLARGFQIDVEALKKATDSGTFTEIKKPRISEA